MKYQFELSLLVRTEGETASHYPKPGGIRKVWNYKSIDTIVDSSLTGLLSQLLVRIALIHKTIVDDLKLERQMIDDDIPF